MPVKKDYLQGIRAFFFDLDGTIYRQYPDSHVTLIRILNEEGCEVTAEKEMEGRRWRHDYWGRSEQIAADREQYDEDEAFRQNFIRRYLGVMLSETCSEEKTKAIISRFTENYSPEGRLVPGVKELLWTLREKRYKLGLVSNRREPLTGVAIEMGVIDHFHFTLAAAQVNSWKPDPEIFQHAMSMAGMTRPEEVAYIGDNYYTDIVGATNAGMRAVLIDEHGVFADKADDCLLLGSLDNLAEYLPE